MIPSKHASLFSIVLAVLTLLAGQLFLGCNNSTTTEPGWSTPMVNMAVSFSKGGTAGILKRTALPSADSLRIDSAVVVFSRIKFLLHSDSVHVDTSDASNDSLDHDSSIVFKGPFVVHVTDTVAIDFASQTLPAGSYDGIVFKLHRLRTGEHHEDSDRHSSHRFSNDTGVAGSSITVWGSVYKDSAWTPFLFTFNDELKFRVKGNFIVPVSTSSINIALNINMGAWFKNPVNGSLLDPTDSSWTNRRLIREAIILAFGGCRGGHDRGDGHPR